MKYWSLFLTLLVILLLNGCATQQSNLKPIPLEQRSTVWQKHLEQLDKITAFNASGTFIYQDDDTKHQARFLWKQKALNDYQVLLLSPFGTTLLKLDVTPRIATLTSEGKTYHATDPESLVYQLTQLAIPFSALQPWLLGMTHQTNHFELNQYALLQKTAMTQNQKTWQLFIQQYQVSQGIALPSLLVLTQSNLKLTLKIEHWQVNYP